MTNTVDVISVTLDRVYPPVRSMLSTDVFNIVYSRVYTRITCAAHDPLHLSIPPVIREDIT